MRLEDIPPAELKAMMMEEAKRREENTRKKLKGLAGSEIRVKPENEKKSNVLKYKGKEPPEFMLRRAVNMILREKKHKRIEFDMGDGVTVTIKRENANS